MIKTYQPPVTTAPVEVLPPVRRRSRVRLAAYCLLAVEIPLAVAVFVTRGSDPGPGPTPGPHSFLGTQADGVTPVRWDPCSAIGYVVDWDLAPAGAVQLWTEAEQTVEEATGLTLTGLGSSTVSAVSTSAPPLTGGAEVLVSWVAAADDPLFASGEAVGWARAVPSVGPDGTSVYTSGTVALDADWFTERMAAGDTAAARSVLLHELGHLVGLDHVQDDGQLMYPSTTDVPDYQGGDLDGLAELGPVAGPPCR